MSIRSIIWSSLVPVALTFSISANAASNLISLPLVKEEKIGKSKFCLYNQSINLGDKNSAGAYQILREMEPGKFQLANQSHYVTIENGNVILKVSMGGSAEEHESCAPTKEILLLN